MNNKYRVIIASLIIILVFTSLRFLVFNSYIKSQKAVFRAQVLSQATKEVQKISMPFKDLYTNHAGIEWKEHNRELVVKGIHYEVVKITHTGNESQVFLLEDKAENELFSAFFKSQPDTDNPLNVIKLMLCMVFVGAALYALNILIASIKSYAVFFCVNYTLIPVFKSIKPPESLRLF